MINYFDLGIILIIHFIADFICQTHWQATNKSKNNIALLCHTGMYANWWILGAMLLLCAQAYRGEFITPSSESAVLWFLIPFVLITFIAHTITDYFTSRWTSKLYAKGDIHNFFVVIGFDQVLHYTQLLATYYLLM